MTETVTTYAEALALLAIALGLAWLTADHFGMGWALLAFGSVILCMSGLVSLLRRPKGGVE